MSEARKRWAKNNPDKVKAYKKKWYDKNRESILAKRRNPETRAKHRAYAENYRNTDLVRYRIGRKRAHAKSQGVEFNLTEEWFRENLDRGCAVTGKTFSDDPRSPWRPEVDRIIHKGPYTVDNCRLVCAIFNRARMGYSDEEVRELAESLLDHAIL